MKVKVVKASSSELQQTMLASDYFRPFQLSLPVRLHNPGEEAPPPAPKRKNKKPRRKR